VADFCRQTQNFKATYCSPRTDSISHMQLQTTRAFTAHCFWTHARTRFLGCVRIPLEPVFTLQLVSSPFVQCMLQRKFILTRFWLALLNGRSEEGGGGSEDDVKKWVPARLPGLADTLGQVHTAQGGLLWKRPYQVGLCLTYLVSNKFILTLFWLALVRRKSKIFYKCCTLMVNMAALLMNNTMVWSKM
jgi:hypothetical protein